VRLVYPAGGTADSTAVISCESDRAAHNSALEMGLMSVMAATLISGSAILVGPLWGNANDWMGSTASGHVRSGRERE